MWRTQRAVPGSRSGGIYTRHRGESNVCARVVWWEWVWVGCSGAHASMRHSENVMGTIESMVTTHWRSNSNTVPGSSDEGRS